MVKCSNWAPGPATRRALEAGEEIGPNFEALVAPPPAMSKAAKKNAKRSEKREAAAAHRQMETAAAAQQQEAAAAQLRHEATAAARQQEAAAAQRQVTAAQRQMYAEQQKQPIESPEQQRAQLRWPRRKFVPLRHEQEIVKVLVRHKQERGMMRDWPEARIREVRGAASRLDISLDQALSLRRHHIRNNHRCPNQEQVVQLGTEAQIRAAADLFEEAVAAHLDASGVSYLSEAQQRERNGEERPMPPTPDFLLPSPLAITGGPEALEASWTHPWRRDASDGQLYTFADFQHYYGADADRMWAAAQPRTGHAGGPLHWIEVKHYYGASTIPMDGKSAAGKLFGVVDKYVRRFGPGAIVLCEGCGEWLAAELEARGALVLDALPLDLSRVQKQMSTWCAGPGGELLP